LSDEFVGCVQDYINKYKTRLVKTTSEYLDLIKCLYELKCGKAAGVDVIEPEQLICTPNG